MEWNDPETGIGASVDPGIRGSDTRGNVSARTTHREYYVSRDEKSLFHHVSSYNATSGAVVISVENSSSNKDYYLGDINFSCNTNCTWKVFKTLVADTPAGTTLASVNMNSKGSDNADIIAFGNAAVTGVVNTITALVGIYRSGAFSDEDHDFKSALILGRGEGINVEIAGATLGSCSLDVTIDGYLQ